MAKGVGMFGLFLFGILCLFTSRSGAGEESLPSVTVTASDSTAVINSSDHATVTFSRTGSTSNPLTLQFAFGGNATTWDDYRLLNDTMPDQVVFPAGQSSVTLTIKATGVNNVANPETATFTIYNRPAYTVGSPGSATFSILAEGTVIPPPVSGSAIDSTVLALPVPGDHALRILSPTLLELRLINTKESVSAPVSPWNFDDSNGRVVVPQPSRFQVTVNGQPVTVTKVGLRRRPLYAPLQRRDLRIDNSLFLELADQIPDGGQVEVKNPDEGLWPDATRFKANAEPLRESMVIHVNQEGYAPDLPKKIMVGYYLGSLGEMDLPASPGFQIVDAATGSVVYPLGTTGAPGYAALTPRPDNGHIYNPKPYQEVFEADFSEFRTPGRYRLVIPKIGASLPFLIDDGIPLAFARTYALGLYHQRCGTSNELPHTRHVHGACHLAPASVPIGSGYSSTWSVIAQESAKRNQDNPVQTAPQLKDEDSMLYPWVRTSPIDVRGGHHDAGDYSKYTINSAHLAHILIFAVDSMRDVRDPNNVRGIKDLDNLGLPESGDGIPDLLQEAKWETDFLARMQDDDGGFYFLVYPSQRRYESNVLPDQGDPQIVWPKTTAVTAAATAALAQAASSPEFRARYPQAAVDYLDKARRGWSFLMAAIAQHGDEGSYQKITHYGDNFTHKDEIAWAAVELYLATGEEQYRRELHRWLPDPSSATTFRWGWWRLSESYGNAIRSYAFAASSGRTTVQNDPEYVDYVAKCRTQILAAGEDALRWSNQNAYASSFPEESKRFRAAGWYFSLDQAMDMAVAWQLLQKAEYVDALVGNMNYEGGSNPVNVSYVTGLGIKRQREIVHQYAQNDGRVLPPTGIPLGNIQTTAFTQLSFYGNGTELSNLVFPTDDTEACVCTVSQSPCPAEDQVCTFYPFYDRWADSYNVTTEFVHVNQARGLLALAFLAVLNPAQAVPGRPTSVGIVAPASAVAAQDSVTFRLDAPGVDFSKARIVWEARDQEPAYGSTFTISPASEGDQWVEAEVAWPDGHRAFGVASFVVDSPVVKWVDDALPAGAAPTYTSAPWSWVTASPLPYSREKAHQSAGGSGLHELAFTDATATLQVGAGDTLFAYVYLDPSNPPREIMLHWNDGSWDHRAYWGVNEILYGANGTAGRYYVGPLPATGRWVPLEIPAGAVGLEGRTVNGMCFSALDGRATWDLAGRAKPGAALP